MPQAIEIQAVSKRYGQLQALDQVSFTVAPGEFFALLGPNGAGKTTLISAMAGLSRPDSGSIRIMGHDVVGDFRAARKALGVVPQELVFDPFLSVRETLRFQSGYFGLARNDDWIDELLFAGPGRQGAQQYARAVRRHEAPGDGGAGAGAPPAGHRAGRTHRRCRRGTAPELVGVRAGTEPRRPHHRADHALPGRSRGLVFAHRDAEKGRLLALESRTSCWRTARAAKWRCCCPASCRRRCKQ